MSLKLDFKPGFGTLTSVSAYNRTKEIHHRRRLRLPARGQLVFNACCGTDLNQSQFLDVTPYSQELRFTSQDGGCSWIAGAYYVHTDRFISTGNMVDTGAGVFPVYREPRLTRQQSRAPRSWRTRRTTTPGRCLATLTFEFNDQWKFDAAVRYDEDKRENTTETPHNFLPGLRPPSTGEVRHETLSETQPKATLRYKPTDNMTFYGGWSRGFRSGGFNQTGVGAVADASGIAGVNDLFEAEVADTWEVGVKGQFLDRG